MTPKEFKIEMEKTQIGSDLENNHCEADDLMCKLLRELGYGDGVDIFEKLERWYA